MYEYDFDNFEKNMRPYKIQSSKKMSRMEKRQAGNLVRIDILCNMQDGIFSKIVKSMQHDGSESLE